MNNKSGTKTFKLPMRLAFMPTNNGKRPDHVIAGIVGSWGDAGWTVIEFSSLEAAKQGMSNYPQARMPCWKRIESGEIRA